VSFKRFEILLPLQHNDGTRIDEVLINATWRELVAEFKAVTVEPTPLRGLWVDDGREYEDVLIKRVIDLEDTPAVRHFLGEFKERLKVRFDQVEVWITAHSIEIL
jgi:hypothetical protein